MARKMADITRNKGLLKPLKKNKIPVKKKKRATLHSKLVLPNKTCQGEIERRMIVMEERARAILRGEISLGPISLKRKKRIEKVTVKIIDIDSNFVMKKSCKKD